MPLLNAASGYGAVTKILHWAVVVLFALQFTSAGIMLRVGPDGTTLGLNQATYYNWHKSLGLLALVVAVLRLLARKSGRLPDWAPTLGNRERVFIHRAEQVLYAAMFIMPISGFIYVMAGGYGVNLFGVLEFSNPIGERAWLASATGWVHTLTAIVLALTLAGHIGLVLWHQFVLKDGLLCRMLPRRQADEA
ncbi:MAG: cytochrome b [Hyphomicrobiaceae bacterium]